MNVAVDQPHIELLMEARRWCASVDGRKGLGVYVLWRLLAKDLLRACLVATEEGTTVPL